MELTCKRKKLAIGSRETKNLECSHLPSDFQVVWVIMNHKLLLIDMVVYRISLVTRWRFFHFQNNRKDLDLSCKMDLDFWDCLGRVKLVL